MPSIQAIYATVFCATGALALAVAHYQVERREIGKVRLISPRAKHLLGLVCIVIGLLFFVGQFIHRR
jgi:hypothetical protein